MVEKSMFQRKKIKLKRRKKKTRPDEETDDEGQEDGKLGEDELSGDDDDTEDKEDDTTYTWCKNVDEDLRRWIETDLCRRDIADDYFGNPPIRKREFKSSLSHA